MVPLGGPSGGTPKFVRFKSVEDSIKLCAKANGCPEEPKTEESPDKAGDGTTVTKKTYGPGKDGARGRAVSSSRVAGIRGPASNRP